jgi:HEPN domain-containing protein
MITFNREQFITTTLQDQRSELLSLILEIVQADFIYLLGTCVYKRTSENIFCRIASDSQYLGDFYFLILCHSTDNKTLPQLQEQIEQHCSRLMPVTTIVLETSVFNGWLAAGHPFSRTVSRSAIPVFESGNVFLSPIGDYDMEAELKNLETLFRDGLNKSQEFLAGADLYQIRKQYRLAAFMLHQAAEQGLGTLLKIGTSYYCCTHNIDRLIRYVGMFCSQVLEVFPRKTDNDKRLFQLLQKAYIDSRYREEYSIGFTDLSKLTERVRTIHGILAESGNRIISEKR